MNTKNSFITFEGIDGCGKSTQIKLLSDYLTEKKIKYILTREPGGTKISEKTRELILDIKNESMHPETELLLYLAARAQHVKELIQPSLDKGLLVLSDRFSDATFAYQGCQNMTDMTMLRTINNFATSGLEPSLTILLDISSADSFNRRKKRGIADDRMEAKGNIFLENVREYYLKLSKENQGRFLVIDANLSINEIFAKIKKRLEI